MDKRKIIIDTDTGSDDAVAMLFALLDESVEVLAVTTVFGNIPISQASKNALITIEAAGSYKPPVFEGVSKQLNGIPSSYAFKTHGEDGMGDMGYAVSSGYDIESEHAVDAMIRIIDEHPEDTIELVTLGPLTNIGAAITRAPETIKKLKKITVMGGGWMEPTEFWVSPAESNIRNDVISANLVVSCGVPVTLVPINVCRGDMLTTEDEIAMLRNSGSEVAKFSVDCNRTLISFNKDRWGREVIDPADPVAMAAAIAPETIAEERECFITFETNGEWTRGMMLFDPKGFYGREKNATLVTKMDSAKYKEYAYNLLQQK